MRFRSFQDATPWRYQARCPTVAGSCEFTTAGVRTFLPFVPFARNKPAITRLTRRANYTMTRARLQSIRPIAIPLRFTYTRAVFSNHDLPFSCPRPRAMNTKLRIIGFVLLLGLTSYFFWNHPPNPWTWMQTLGVCMMAAGFPLWLAAHVQLGSSFAVSAQARALVTRGLYAKFRSPIYLFGSVGIAGAFLLLGRPYLLLVFVVLIPLQVARTRTEARTLEEKFGDEYRLYRRRTWF